MQLFKQTAAEKFTPKTIKLSKLYHANTGGKALSGSAFSKAQRALTKAGFSDTEIRKTLFKDEAISVNKIKTIADALHKNQVYGFEKNPTTSIKQFLNKERVKAQSIARIMKEHILEASEENIGPPKSISSLNLKGVSPNSPKPGEASILSRYSRNKRGPNVTTSFSDRANAKSTSSFKNTSSATGSIEKPTSRGVIPARPKF